MTKIMSDKQRAFLLEKAVREPLRSLSHEDLLKLAEGFLGMLSYGGQFSALCISASMECDSGETKDSVEFAFNFLVKQGTESARRLQELAEGQ